MNKRHEPRPRLMTYLKVHCAETGRVVGRIIDLTTQGVRLVTNEEIQLEAEIHLVIPFDSGSGQQEELRIDARCRWTGPDVNPDYLCAGLEFVEVRPRQEALLARIIQRYRYEHLCS